MTDYPESIRLTIKENGWRQGSFLAPDFTKEIYGKLYSEGNLAIVINQTCDLVNEDFDEEPRFETLLFQVPPKGENHFLKTGFSPRKIQLEIINGSETCLYEASMRSKTFVDRKELLSRKSQAEISIRPESFPFFRSWLAKRYNRYAKPDDFDTSLKAVDDKKKKLAKAMKRIGNFLVAPYIKIQPDRDLDKDEKYSVEVILVIDTSECGADEDAYVTLEGNKIGSVLRQFCENVKVETKEDSKFTLQAARYYHYWDFDQYSLEDPNPVDIR